MTDFKFDVESLDLYYGNFKALKDITMQIRKMRLRH